MSARDGGETAWERHGSGPAVAMIHGFGLNRAMWQWQLPALTPHFSVLTYDLLGHGESAPPAATPDLAMFSGQLLRLMDHCEIERAAVVGFSLGGMIARRFALDHSDRLSALAILHSAHDRTPAEREAVRERVRHTREHGPAANVDSALERWFTPAFRAREPELIALIRRWITSNDPVVFPRIYRVLAEGDAEIARGLERIACPTLVMTGEDDPGNTPAMSRAMAGLIPGARLDILPGLRHMALAESPAAINGPLCAFLRGALETERLREGAVRERVICEHSPTISPAKPAPEPAGGANGIERAPLRPPSKVMRLARMGAFHPTRVSFVRTLVRRMARERWRIERERFDLDANGYGDVVYRVVTPAGTLRFVAFSNWLDPSERTDRVIATQWDSTFVLTAAEVDDALLADYRKNIPLQEAGRCHPFDLVLSRANRSVRLFEHVVECLADGRQPAFAKLAEVGYLMRTTAVYGNGKFGVGDFEAVCAGGVFSLPFQAEMLTVYLARLLSFDLVEHIARARAPERAVPLAPAVARCLGVGNATGLGMAPFLVTHPRLLDRWMHARELGLARVRAVERAEPERVAQFADILARARRHIAQWRTDDARQSARIYELEAELRWLSEWSGKIDLAGMRTPWDATMRAVESRGCAELEEMTLSLLLELYPELVDSLENGTGADERLATVPAMRVHELAALVERKYGWALDFDFDDPNEQHRFWYYSEEKEEPRLGERFSEPGAEREYPLHVARDVRELHRALVSLGPSWRERSIAELLLERPRYRRIVRRVQALAGAEYAEIRDNVIGRTCLPIDMLRCKLAIFGANKFDPKSDRWTRITLFQGAPLPGELDREDVDDWAFPVIPVELDRADTGDRHVP